MSQQIWNIVTANVWKVWNIYILTTLNFVVLHTTAFIWKTGLQICILDISAAEMILPHQRQNCKSGLGH